MHSIPRLAEHIGFLRESLDVRAVYCDLDGTLLGPGGSLFAHPTGITTAPAIALAALKDASIAVVLVSGRTHEQVREAARTVGAAGYVAEMGGLVVLRRDREEVVIRHTGAFRGRGTAYEAIERSGAAGVLLEAFGGELEPHAPWAFAHRECSMLLRGNVPVADATALLRETGYAWLDLSDNGIIAAAPGRFPNLHVEEVHIYHLAPAGLSKRSGVAEDRARRGLERRQAIAIGDSAADAAVATEVGAFFLVANGTAAVKGSTLEKNVYMTEASYGLGFVEGVMPFIDPIHHDRAAR